MTDRVLRTDYLEKEPFYPEFITILTGHMGPFSISELTEKWQEVEGFQDIILRSVTEIQFGFSGYARLNIHGSLVFIGIPYSIQERSRIGTLPFQRNSAFYVFGDIEEVILNALCIELISKLRV